MLTTGITALFSLTCALAVANVYSAQPLLDSMAVSLKVSPGMIGSVITATQAGYAIGLLFLVPLGDWLNRKYVVMSQLLLSVAALVAAGLSPNIATLLGAMLIVGPMAVVVQVMVAWVAILATTQKRGQAVGTLTSADCFRYPVISVYLRRDSRYRRLASRVSHGCLSDVGDCRGRLENHAFAPAAAAATKVRLTFLLKSVFQLYLTELQLRKRDPGAIYLAASPADAMDDHGHAAHRPFLSHTQAGCRFSRHR